jgi:hypothetical protein
MGKPMTADWKIGGIIVLLLIPFGVWAYSKVSKPSFKIPAEDQSKFETANSRMQDALLQLSEQESVAQQKLDDMHQKRREAIYSRYCEGTLGNEWTVWSGACVKKSWNGAAQSTNVLGMQ